jgi:phosphatidylinositol mannoside-binding LppM-like protein
VQAPPVPRRSRAAALLIGAILLVGGLLAGCARVHVALAVQPDDTVTGEIVVATPDKPAADKAPAVTLPADLTSAVDVTPYQQDGYTGSVLRFSHLSFEQTARLTRATFPQSDRTQFDIHRAGGRVLVSGKVDLTAVSVDDRADVGLKMSFPGRVVETNGESDAGTVSWTFTPGEVGVVSAIVAYADPTAPSVLHWTLGLTAVVALAAFAVVVAARRTRNPPVSPPIR